MNYYVAKNNQRINLLDIPTIQFETFRAQLCITNLRPLIFFGADWGENIKLYAALADDEKGEILISSSLLHKSIKEYGKYLSVETINAFTGIEGRIIERLFITSSKNNYELVKNAIIKKQEQMLGLL